MAMFYLSLVFKPTLNLLIFRKKKVLVCRHFRINLVETIEES